MRAAAALIRALGCPQREVQVAIATLLIETHERAPAAIDGAMRRSIETGP